MDNNNLSDELIKSILEDRKQERKWRIIRSVTNIILLAIFALIIINILSPKKPTFSNQPHYSLLKLSGAILPGSNFSANVVIPQLEKAFRDPKSVGVMLEINSPGGTVVQSALIHDAIERLKKQYNKKVIVVGRDLLTSGAYLISTAADKIYVNKDTITGSIGVMMASFNFNGLIKDHNIKRLVFTSPSRKDNGKKDSLDPFLPFDPTQGQGLATTKKLNQTLGIMHTDFIDYVKEGRKHDPHFNPQNKELFSGDFWVGSQSVKNGLTDRLGNQYTAAKQEFKTENFIEYKPELSLIDHLLANAQSSLKSVLAESSTKMPPLAMSW